MAIGHLRLYNSIRGCTVVAAVDTNLKRATLFAKTHNIPEVYASTEDLLEKARIDAVSIVTPDPFHCALTLMCLEAGKHVLCEKPLALNNRDARRMVKAAEKSGVINMVNFSYRNWSSLQKVAELIQAGKLGEIRHVEASYHQAWLVSKAWCEWQKDPQWLWRLSSDHGSKGVLGDVGVHILDFATFPVGRLKNIYCKLKAFKKAPRNRIGKFKLDANDSAVITAEFENGALGSIQTTRWMTGHINRLFLKIAGTHGSIEIDSERGTNSYRICTGKNIDNDLWETVTEKHTPSIHQRFIKSIRTGIQDQPDFARGAEIQKIIDASFHSNTQNMPIKLRA